MNIKEYMSQKNISGQKLARKIGISDGYLSQIVNGVRKPSKYLALVIQAKTKGEIKAKELRPDIKKLA